MNVNTYRYVSFINGFNGPFLPKYDKVDGPPLSYGLSRLDHAVGNVHSLLEAVQYISRFTGFHEFAEFTADEVGTAESGLNSVVLANNTEMVLLPLNEPVFGTKRKSQIQTYLEHNEGPGLQHFALLSKDIFKTLKEMRSRTHLGGFDFMPKPPPTYYRNLRNRVADILTEDQMNECDELGILVDRDDQGVLLQIFTKPIGDRYAGYTFKCVLLWFCRLTHFVFIFLLDSSIIYFYALVCCNITFSFVLTSIQ